MYLILLVVGLLVAAAGFVTIGFGIPINAFSLGNTLIIAGTTAVVGGLLLVGLAAAVRSLQRIADGLGKSPMPRPASRPVEAAEPPQVPPTAQLTPSNMRAPAPAPVPARPPEAIIPRPGGVPRQAEPAEPRFPTAPSGETRGPLDWLRPKSKAKQTEPAMMEVPDEAPLSPRTPPRPAIPSTPVVEPALEPKAWSPSRGARSEEPRAAPRSEPRMLADAASPKDEGLFDVVWPAARPGTGPAIEPARRELAADAPSPMAPPLAPRREEQRPAPASSAERGPAILKSGVIDGMAYTLYADGSIEAELPQGTIRFASIDALRAHLEKHG
jgi:hypothetical protein